MYDLIELDGCTWRRNGETWLPTRPFYAVLGDPIAHSLSPAIQNAALIARELDAEYLPLLVRPGQLKSLKDPRLAEYLAGFNVTAPHKEAVAELCDQRTDQARALAAVNTVKVQDGQWLGHNTDSGGLLAVATEVWRGEDPPERVVVLGAGGSARAAIDAMLRWGVPLLEVRNRSAAGQERIRAWLSTRETATKIRVTGLPTGREEVPTGPTLWLSCLAGRVACAAFLPAAAGSERAALMDLRYGDQLPPEDPPLGFDYADGRPLLLMQGGLSFAWWHGPPIPWQAMREALSNR